MADSIAATAITVGLSLVSLYVGMSAAGAQQDREVIRRQRGVAKALLADLERIESDIKRMKDAGLLPWTGKPPIAAPKIHPWVEGLIAQIADEAPEVVTGFMRLERSLATLQGLAEHTRRLWARVDDAHNRFTTLEDDRRAAFQRGVYDPRSDGFLPPEEGTHFDELSDDVEELAAVSRIDLTARPRSAAAKLAWLDAIRHLEGALGEYTWQPNEGISIIVALEETLLPIAARAVPSLAHLAMKSAFPVPEDAEVDRLERAEAGRRLRRGN